MFALRTRKERSDGLASLPSVYARFTGSICLLRKLDIRLWRSICPAGVRDEGTRFFSWRRASKACNEMTFGREIRFAIEMTPLAS